MVSSVSSKWYARFLTMPLQLVPQYNPIHSMPICTSPPPFSGIAFKGVSKVRLSGSRPPVVVLEPLNVVLIAIVANLHFYDFKRFVFEIRNSVGRSKFVPNLGETQCQMMGKRARPSPLRGGDSWITNNMRKGFLNGTRRSLAWPIQV